MPFASLYKRAIHFTRHGAEFGAATPEEYEQMADAFMFGLRDHDTRECFRVADKLRFKDSNRYFGVSCVVPEFVRTFYQAPATKVANRGGCGAFFAYECARSNL
jgi:hypothetical protein